MILGVAFSILVENFIGVFVRITLNLSVTLGSLDILVLLILLICHKKYIFAFGVYFYFFLSVLYFSLYCSFAFLFKFIPSYFVALVEWDVLKSRSPVMYRNTTGFLYPAFMSCSFIEFNGH